MGSALTTLLTLSLAAASSLVEPGFTPIGGHDGVAVYLRKDASAIDLAAVGEFAAPPAAVQAALLDYGAATSVIKHLRESKIVARQPNTLYVYQHLKLPVISDRDYTLKVSFDASAARGFSFAVDNAAGPPPRKGMVRLSMLEGRWELTPLDGGRATRAVYHVKLDFAGAVPRWMVRGGAARDIPDIYVAFRRAINQRISNNSISVSRR
jgi:hypothetical protein